MSDEYYLGSDGVLNNGEPVIDISELDPEIRLLAGKIVKERWDWISSRVFLKGEKNNNDEAICLLGGLELTFEFEICHLEWKQIWGIHLSLPDPIGKPEQIKTQIYDKAQPNFRIEYPNFRDISSEDAADLIINLWPIYEVMDS